MSTSYKQHFAAKADAVSYDQKEYGKGSYADLLWGLERAALETLVAEFCRMHPRIRYLDFASGTGRVAGFIENFVGDATAIEVSDSMAARARERVRKTNVLCRDITANGSEVEGKYELITAFRFFLNAEPELRLAAIRSLAARLQDDTSWLILNNHGNLWSLKIIGWPYHRLRGFRQGWKPYGNYLRHSQVKRLLDQAGLRVVSRIGLGVLGGKVCSLFPFDKAVRLEAKATSVPFLRLFGQDQIYVVSRQPATGSGCSS